MDTKQLPDPALYEYLVQRIAQSFVNTCGFVSHHVDSYENFVTHQITEIIAENSPLQIFCAKQKVMHVIRMEKVCIGKPVLKESNGFIRRLFPKEAFLRRESYMADTFVDLRHEIYRSVSPTHYKLTEVKIFQNVLLFRFPCMRNSSICNDFGSLTTLRERGSFIINGYSKCIVMQEKIKCNYPYCFSIKRATKFAFRCEVRSWHAAKIRSTSTLNIYMSGKKTDCVPMITLLVPFIKTHIPIIVIFRMLGINRTEDILNFIISKKSSQRFTYLANSILCSDDTGTVDMKEDDLYDWVGLKGASEKIRKKRILFIKHIFQNEFLPHCATKQGDIKINKAFFLGYCVRKLVRIYLKEIPSDDIDSYVNKRISTTGSLMAILTRQLLRNFLKTVHIQVFKSVNNGKFINITDFFTHRRISTGLKYAFSTGNWGIQKGQSNQSGVCQVLNTMNICAKFSHLRLINTPLNRDGKVPEPRQLHRTHWGAICAAETPEGKSVGLLNASAFFGRVRTGCPSQYIIDILYQDMEVITLEAYLSNKPPHTSMVLVNGIIAGFTNNPLELVRTYRRYRSWYSVPIDSNVSYQSNTDQVCINTDGQDAFRPLFCLENLHKLKTVYRLYRDMPSSLWTRMLIEGVIEYVNKEEEAELYIVVTYEEYLENLARPEPELFTHMEIHASFTIHGVAAGIIPFSNHNQAPRNIYQSAMGKQAISSQPLDFSEHLENKSFSLVYPQRPPVTTWSAEAIGYSDEPTGQAVTVAIQCITGFNQEDSVLLNKDALDRGLFRTAVHRTFKDSEAKHGADMEKFNKCNDEELAGRRKGDYSKIDAEDGIAAVGTKLKKNDVIVGKTIEFTSVQKNNFSEEKKYTSSRRKRDRSTLIKTDENCRVEKVVMSCTKDGLRSVSLRTIAFRGPEIGDKVSSLHGQKGIVGMIIPAIDMPRTQDGVVPDLIMNVHAVPSRMTIGMLKEMHMGKLACLEGLIADGTPFRNKTVKEMETLLREWGLNGLGKEIMYSGTTGLKLDNPVFVGVCYYQRLRHMVQDKIHGRARGPNQVLTRQPVEGRSRKGGFRLGEMERDSLISHGVSSVLIDRLLNNSDRFETVVCETCGMLCEGAAPTNIDTPSVLHQKPYCRHCDSNSNIARVVMPYALKLLSQELAACHIKMKFEF